MIRWGTNQTFSNTEDGDMVTKIIPCDLVIASGITITTQYRCKGLHIQVMGNCYIYGTIDMTARGGNIAGQNVGLEFYSDRNTITYNDANWSSLPTARKIAATGGAAVVTVCPPAGIVVQGVNGNSGIDGACGAGGAGTTAEYKAAGFSSNYSCAGTSFSGGPGSSAASGLLGAGTAPVAPAGKGGIGAASSGCSGGAGNPGGEGGTAGTGETGTGGLIILSVLGFLYIASSGVVKANGKDGGTLTNCYSGGASGGGSVNILYGTYTNNGTIQANGGIGGAAQGSSYPKGGDGGAGSVRINSLRAA